MKKLVLSTLGCFFLCVVFSQNFWSNPSTWPGNIKPQAGDNVTIPMGTTIILDENTPELGGLTILGTLQFAHQNLNLSASWIMLHGTLQIGTPSNLFTHKAIITLTGSDVNESVMGMGTRGIMVMGGALELHAASPSVLYTKLNQNADAGATAIQVVQTTNWNIGDEIALTPTDYYNAANGNAVSQRVSITGTAGNNISISQGLNSFRWGLLQYATPTGISLDSNNRVVPPKANTDSTFTPTILDERAVVANLTRNIVIQAPNDALWMNQGFGVHIMVMGTGATAHLNGVEIRRGGQRNRLGRYPFHWHMLSYSGSSTLADATGQYIQNSVINSSTNRGIVIHGTNGVLVKANVVYDILGHGIFTEDAVERRNIIDSNVVMRVRNTTATGLPILKVHEGNSSDDFGSSGFWISNPDNTLTNNIASDCNAFGIWLAFTTQPWGESINVLHSDGLLLNPSRLLFGKFDNNTASSNRNRGIMLDVVENSNAGTVIPFQYQSTINGRNPEWPNTTLRRFTLSRYKVWKNGMSGIWDRAAWPNNYEVVSADNCGRFFAGSGADGIIERSLVIGTSLNHLMNGTDRPLLIDAVGGNQTPAAFATYHSAFDIRDNIVINFPLVDNTRSGAFATEDYYIRPVDKGQVRNKNNLLIQSHPGVKLLGIANHFSLAGALWDPLGNWNNGVVDSNKYFVYDNPFFTYEQTPIPVQGAANAGGTLVNGPFYGINDFEINRDNDPQQDLMAIKVNRLNNNFDSVATWQITQAGDVSWILAHMRHFAAHKNGYYDLSFPTINNVTDVAFTVENMLTVNDSLIIAVEYAGTQDIHQVYTSTFPSFMSTGHANWPTTYANKHVFQQVKSRAEVINAGGVGAYWQDRVNNKVWIKLKGGMQMHWNEADYGVFSDERLYKLFGLRIHGGPVTTWTGNTSTNWADGNNWTNGIPSSTTNAYIPLTANQPSITSNAVVQNITVNEGVVVTNTAQLTIAGTINNHGAILGTVIPNNANYTQVINGAGSIQNFSIQNTNGVTIYPSVNAKLNITGMLQLNNNTLNTNNNLIFKSTALATARLANIGTGIINGSATVEKFIPGGGMASAIPSKRAFRFLSHPFNGAISVTQLKNNPGIDITGLGGTMNGFSQTPTGNPSVFKYSTAMGNTGISLDPGWQPITNALVNDNGNSNAWNRYQGLRVFVRGSQGQGLIGNDYLVQDATISLSGTLNTGNQIINLANGGSNWNLVGNPYASAVNLRNITRNNTSNFIYVWRLNQGLRGGYSAGIDISSVDYELPAFSSFFIQSTGANPSLVFEEADKVTNEHGNIVFGTADENKKEQLRISIESPDGKIFWDEWILNNQLNTSAKKEAGKDADKLFNTDFSLFSINKEGDRFSVDAREWRESNTIHLGILSTQKREFKLNIATTNFTDDILLKDNWLNKITTIKPTDSYNFSITDDIQSQGNTRFQIIFKQKNEEKDTVQASALQVTVLPNPTSSIVTINFLQEFTGEGEVKLFTIDGKLLHIVKLNNSIQKKVSIDMSALAKGTYLVNIKQKDKAPIIKKIIKN